MAEMLLINPSKRRKARKARRSNPSPAQRRARAKFAAMARARARGSRAARSAAPASNPVGRRRSRRRANPVAVYRRRRRRNPIGGVSMSGILGLVKQAAVQGAGSVVFDVAYGYVNRMLPASMQATPGQIGVGTVIKLGLTAALGNALSGPTRGLSRQAAMGSLTVQLRDITAGFLPSGMTMGRVGYASPARVYNGSQRISPNRVGALTPPGASMLLNAYTPPGASMLLNGAGQSAREREGFMR